jgi:hypothetical protein
MCPQPHAGDHFRDPSSTGIGQLLEARVPDIKDGKTP